MPTWRERQGRFLWRSAVIPPAHADIHLRARVDSGQAEVKVRAPPAGMAVAGVHLGDEFTTVGPSHGSRGANRRATGRVLAGMAGPDDPVTGRKGIERQQQVQAKKCAWIGGIIAEKER